MLAFVVELGLSDVVEVLCDTRVVVKLVVAGVEVLCFAIIVVLGAVAEFVLPMAVVGVEWLCVVIVVVLGAVVELVPPVVVVGVEVLGVEFVVVLGAVAKTVLLLVVVGVKVLRVVIVIVLGVVSELPVVVVDVVEGNVNEVVSLLHVKQQFTAACCPVQSTVSHEDRLSPYSQPDIFVDNFLHEPQQLVKVVG